jgi:hypothetical protein
MFPRVKALIFTVLIIGVVSFAAIKAYSYVMPMLDHGTMAQHDDGTVVSMNAGGTVLTLKSAVSGKMVEYECSARCRSQIQHIRRHITEKAHTDVYFIQQGTGLPVAIDVD